LASFSRRYQGKSVVLDLEVVRAQDGHIRHSYQVLPAGEEAHLEFDGLQLLKSLPLDSPRRLIFGARLQEVVGDPRGGWLVRLDPMSGVLLTDADGARLCCHALAEAGARQVLQEQRAWVLGAEETGLPPVKRK
jgi:hypothetical protein